MTKQKNNLVTKDFFNKILNDRFEKQKDEIEGMFTNWRSEFFEKIDPILKEVTASREERVLIEDRVEKLEEVVFES